ncbi:hypothetical protein THAOC_09907 [Thalassiosira oceanica]|uniref:Uncharacterized protein n=1 Tax=Thalassiosira oceanica TaxID=159749 RepID=K0STZ1_THAOC|nr:hypothetical protein THAOC_09907 [Thalassiosira oceanica]|eukprot:EJK68880.1 hypothetical protein THAOC_09907 [Thalassiosira oceanica]
MSLLVDSSPPQFIVTNDTNSWTLFYQPVLNTLVVEASGPYSKFIGTYLNQTIIEADPNFMADITLTAAVNADAVDADDEEQIELYTPTEGTYDFKITSDGGYYAAINNPEGGQIGERFERSD